ncbi:unnamed protein product [Onchocerca flexuosa]|uniref:Uncharacterized protein n=1 Tax=Onchocerca flexuosa TaxID=387005 RepID=A0A183HQ59_9BILA|nr:unnamed protein product [Onchocerca flexuosa]
MSKQSINYKRNRKKPKRSSPGRTPRPFGRIHQKIDFNNIVKDISGLKLTNRLSKNLSKKKLLMPDSTFREPNKKKINESRKITEDSKFPDKLLQYNRKDQSETKMFPAPNSFERQQVENVKKRDGIMEVTKSERFPSTDTNSTIKLSVKQRAQMFEAAVANANESNIPMKNTRRFVNKMDNS